MHCSIHIFLLTIVLLPIGCRINQNTHLDVEEQLHDFGIVRPKSTLKKTFTLKNTSATRIVFSKVVSSCGCTVAKLEKSALTPQESGVVEVSLETGENSDNLIQHVELFVSGKTGRQFVLGVTAKVRAPLSVADRNLQFVFDQYDSSFAPVTTYVSNFTGRPWNTVSVSGCVKPSWVSIERSPVTMQVGATESWKIQITPLANAIDILENGKIVFEASDGEKGVALTSLKTLQNVRAFPSVVVFSKSELRESVFEDVHISVQSPQLLPGINQFCVEGVPPELAITKVSQRADSVTLRITAKPRPESLTCEIRPKLVFGAKRVEDPIRIILE